MPETAQRSDKIPGDMPGVFSVLDIRKRCPDFLRNFAEFPEFFKLPEFSPRAMRDLHHPPAVTGSSWRKEATPLPARAVSHDNIIYKY